MTEKELISANLIGFFYEISPNVHMFEHTISAEPDAVLEEEGWNGRNIHMRRKNNHGNDIGRTRSGF